MASVMHLRTNSGSGLGIGGKNSTQGMLKKMKKMLMPLFNGQTIFTGCTIEILHELVINLHGAIGEGILAEYHECVLKSGMIVLRYNIENKEGGALLDGLVSTWNAFYPAILHQLMAGFVPLVGELGEAGNIRHVTLLAFRDFVLLRTKIFETLKEGQKVHPSIRQMLLMLRSAKEAHLPTENYLQLEKLIVRVIRPYFDFYNRYHPDFSKQQPIEGKKEEKPKEKLPSEEKKVVVANNNEVKLTTKPTKTTTTTVIEDSIEDNMFGSYLDQRHAWLAKKKQLLDLESLSP